MEFDLILDGSKEFYPKLNKKVYHILKVDTVAKQKFMCDIFKKFIASQKKHIDEKHFIGIDFEFNKITKTNRDVALMQMNLENNASTAHIFILYPPELTKKNHNILLKLLSQTKMYKILHGAESLDIPYLFNQLLVDVKLINNFCSNFYDTRFLCECNHIQNNKTNNKCSIYNLLLEQKIINNEQIEALEKIEQNTGPIYLIKIDIHKLNNDVLKYALYDVIYLPELLKKFILMNPIYLSAIPNTTSLINKAKRNIEPFFNELEKLINSMNIYFFYNEKRINTLYKIWENYLTNIDKFAQILSIFYHVPYFKKNIIILLKFVIYQNITNNFKVFINKNATIKHINWEKYWSWLSKYPILYNLLRDYDNFINKK